MAHRTVLLVEDEPLIRLALSDVLLDAGFRVIETGSVLEALAAMGLNDDIDAVVTDVDMPGALNGLDLVRLTTVSKPDIHVVVTSGRSGLRALLPHEIACFPKPANFRNIATHLDEVIDRSPKNIARLFG